MTSQQCKVITIPGWHGSSENHWQTLWEKRYGFIRLEQHDWEQPLRGDWVARLEDVVLEQSVPCVLLAHSLGCMLVASWAAYSKNTNKVKAVMLVAPADVQTIALHGALHSWKNIAVQKLPFKSKLVASRNDPFCSFEKAQMFANGWDADFLDAGVTGHINAESNLDEWLWGYAVLQQLIENKE